MRYLKITVTSRKCDPSKFYKRKKICRGKIASKKSNYELYGWKRRHGKPSTPSVYGVS